MAGALTITACLEGKKKGLAYGNRLILPFHCRMVSITVGLGMSTIAPPDVYYDFSPSDRDVWIIEEDQYTSIYFQTRKNLPAEFGKYQGGVIIECCEKTADIFDLSTHRRLRLRFRDDQPTVTVEAV
jgi:hypothetical protein